MDTNYFLSQNPQNYITQTQPWLDGYKSYNNSINQFVPPSNNIDKRIITFNVFIKRESFDVLFIRHNNQLSYHKASDVLFRPVREITTDNKKFVFLNKKISKLFETGKNSNLKFSDYNLANDVLTIDFDYEDSSTSSNSTIQLIIKAGKNIVVRSDKNIKIYVLKQLKQKELGIHAKQQRMIWQGND